MRFEVNLPLSGDIAVNLQHLQLLPRKRKRNVFRCSFHSGYVHGNSLLFPLSELDTSSGSKVSVLNVHDFLLYRITEYSTNLMVLFNDYYFSGAKFPDSGFVEFSFEPSSGGSSSSGSIGGDGSVNVPLTAAEEHYAQSLTSPSLWNEVGIRKVSGHIIFPPRSTTSTRRILSHTLSLSFSLSISFQSKRAGSTFSIGGEPSMSSATTASSLSTAQQQQSRNTTASIDRVSLTAVSQAGDDHASEHLEKLKALEASLGLTGVAPLASPTPPVLSHPAVVPTTAGVPAAAAALAPAAPATIVAVSSSSSTAAAAAPSAAVSPAAAADPAPAAAIAAAAATAAPLAAAAPPTTVEIQSIEMDDDEDAEMAELSRELAELNSSSLMFDDMDGDDELMLGGGGGGFGGDDGFDDLEAELAALDDDLEGFALIDVE